MTMQHLKHSERNRLARKTATLNRLFTRPAPLVWCSRCGFKRVACAGQVCPACSVASVASVAPTESPINFSTVMPVIYGTNVDSQ